MHIAPSDPPLQLPGGRRYVAPPVDINRVVQKPISQAQVKDPREFQIQQIRRRFAPKEELQGGRNSFAFQMAPSDPDFPFEMTALQCVLYVPLSYPSGGRPSLEVKNKEMGRGYQINVERGFDRLVETSPRATLLSLMNTLDKQLETLLAEPKAETIKIIPNKASSGLKHDPISAQKPSESIIIRGPKSGSVEAKDLQSYSSEQRQVAQARRTAEIRQLEARLGRLPLFSKSSDGTRYTIPIQPRKPDELPVPLQSVNAVLICVPLLYPLEQCKIEVPGVTEEAAYNLRCGFERRVQSSPDIALMGHINYLAQYMHTLAMELPKESSIDDKPSIVEITQPELKEPRVDEAPIAGLFEDKDDRSHIKVIPRPPEWIMVGDEDEDDSDDAYSYNSEDDFSDQADDDHHPAVEPDSSVATANPERGVLLSFPYLELYGIDLLEILSLSITIKCERCKDTMDISNLHDASKSGSGVRSEHCKKCAHGLSIGIF